MLANGLFGVLIGLRAKSEGFSDSAVGLIVSAFYLGLLIGGSWSVRIVIAVGHIRSFAAFASIMSASALGLVLVIDIYTWAGLRLIAGFCMAGMIIITESWLNERSPNHIRGSVMALYMVTNYLGAALGPLLLLFGDAQRFELFCIVSIIYSLALIPVLVTRAAAPKPQRVARLTLSDLWRISPLAMVAIPIAGSMNATFHGLAPAFAHGIGLSDQTASVFISTAILGALLSQWPMGRLSDHADDRRKIIILAASGATVCSFAIVAVCYQAGIPNMALLLACSFAYGALSFTLYPLAAAHANDFAPRDKRLQTASGLLILFGCGAAIGPLISGTLMELISPLALFLLNGTICCTVSVLSIWRMYRRRAHGPGKRDPVVTLPDAHATSGILYREQRDANDRDTTKMPSPRKKR